MARCAHGPNLAACCASCNEVEGLELASFLTSHSNYFTKNWIGDGRRILSSAAYRGVPIQAVNDQVLVDMKRLTQKDYRDLVKIHY